ncbi:hypothetical protein B5F91_04400 [Bacteroides sp. An322]|nr:hypothetical protein B5F91_04400 [Bacteroides sp. An322]
MVLFVVLLKMECLFIVTPDCKSRMSGRFAKSGYVSLSLFKALLRKLAHVVGTKSQPAKAPPRRGDGIPACESSLHVAGRNPGLGKLAHAVGTESRLGKACPRCGDGIPAWESLPTAWGRNPGLGKLRHAVGTESQLGKARPRRGEGIAGFISSGSCR